MTQRFGIDTAVLVRLATGDPRQEVARCVVALPSEGNGEESAAVRVVGKFLRRVCHSMQVDW